MNKFVTKKSIDSTGSLEREEFIYEKKLTAVKVKYTQATRLLKQLYQFLLNDEHIPNLVYDNSFEQDVRLILLSNDIDLDSKKLPQEIKNEINQCGGEIICYQAKFLYNDFNADQVLKEILPAEIDHVFQIDTIKNIKILNLNSDQYKYRKKISQIIYEKNQPQVSSIIVKSQVQQEDQIEKDNKTIQNLIKQSFFQHKLELILGDDMTKQIIQEQNLQYIIDLTEIDYQPSMEVEREKIIQNIDSDQVVCDLFGDLFLDLQYASLKGKIVVNVNNDNNLYNAFQINILNNKIPQNKILLFNANLLQFLKSILKESLFNENKFVGVINISKIVKDLNFIALFVGLFRYLKANEHYETHPPKLEFYVGVDTSSLNITIKQYLCDQLNKIYQTLFDSEEKLFTASGITISFPGINFNNRVICRAQIQLTKEILFNKNSALTKLLHQEEINKYVNSQLIQQESNSLKRDRSPTQDKEVQNLEPKINKQLKFGRSLSIKFDDIFNFKV